VYQTDWIIVGIIAHESQLDFGRVQPGANLVNKRPAGRREGRHVLLRQLQGVNQHQLVGRVNPQRRANGLNKAHSVDNTYRDTKLRCPLLDARASFLRHPRAARNGIGHALLAFTQLQHRLGYFLQNIREGCMLLVERVKAVHAQGLG